MYIAISYIRVTYLKQAGRLLELTVEVVVDLGEEIAGRHRWLTVANCASEVAAVALARPQQLAMASTDRTSVREGRWQ
jgi:hypothetical protein